MIKGKSGSHVRRLMRPDSSAEALQFSPCQEQKSVHIRHEKLNQYTR